ncbi:MAG: methyltransferase domain-containing protein [Bacteroidetes bacterium]|nr:methyltransferase domain-containing protein [Bacteroidota bacterium]
METRNAENAVQCIVCGSTRIERLISLDDVPIHCNVLWPTREEARRAPHGDLQLGFCTVCGHIFNTTFDPALMEYTQEYENSLHFSQRFQSYAEGLADRLVQRYGVRDKNVIDIGCGKGDFLALLCSLGNNRGTGFDPSYEPEHMRSPSADRMTIVRDFYSPEYSSYKADLITCRHVLEHIQHPREFVETVSRSIGGRTETILFFEVPNVLYTLRDMGIWDLIYEHCSYFSGCSLSRLFMESGFTVLDQSELYEGQFLGIDLVLRGSTDTLGKLPRPEGMEELVKRFSRNYQEKVSSWNQHFGTLAAEQATVVVWGGGSKGVTFLNTTTAGDVAKFMVDINPRKQGMYVPGTGQEVIAPERLRAVQPDVVIVMNPIYEQEIRSTLSELSVRARLLVA